MADTECLISFNDIVITLTTLSPGRVHLGECPDSNRACGVQPGGAGRNGATNGHVEGPGQGEEVYSGRLVLVGQFPETSQRSGRPFNSIENILFINYFDGRSSN